MSTYSPESTVEQEDLPSGLRRGSIGLAEH